MYMLRTLYSVYHTKQRQVLTKLDEIFSTCTQKVGFQTPVGDVQRHLVFMLSPEDQSSIIEIIQSGLLFSKTFKGNKHFVLSHKDSEKIKYFLSNKEETT